MRVLNGRDQGASAGSGARPHAAQVVTRILLYLLIGGVLSNVPEAGLAAEAIKPNQVPETRIQALIPDVERYITSGMKAFDVPGLAIGIIANDKLVYGKGFGVRGKAGSGKVDTRTVFQIGSATKGFLATTLAMMVDRGRLKWDALIMEFQATGARFRLEPWDGDILAVRLAPSGRFAAMAKNLGNQPSGLAQFLADAAGKLTLLRLTFDDGQAYEFQRETLRPK